MNKELLITNRRSITESFGKTGDDVTRDIEIMRQWFRTQIHLPEVPSDNMIEMFLVNNKFSMERTKQKMDMYYSIRTLIPEIYSNCNPSLAHMQGVHEMGYFIPLPKLTKGMLRVEIMKIFPHPDKFDAYKYFSHQINVLEIRIHEDLALGDVVIVDLEHLKVGHLSRVLPMHLKKIMTILEKVFANRVKEIHIINSPNYVDSLINICRTVMKPKIFERIKIHSTNEELYTKVPLEILPSDYGGEERSLAELNELWKIKLKEYGGRFDDLDSMKVKENLRPEPLENDDILGYHGNFKKLDVD